VFNFITHVCKNNSCIFPNKDIVFVYVSPVIGHRTPSSAFNHRMALNDLLCADVPLRTYTFTDHHTPTIKERKITLFCKLNCSYLLEIAV